MNINPLDTGEPFEIELLNPNPTSRRNKDGAMFRISFQVDEATHSFFMNARESNLRLLGLLTAIHDTDEEKAVKNLRQTVKQKTQEVQQEAKGPYGKMWSELLYHKGFANCPGVREWIDANRISEGSEDHDVLKCIFAVNSLSVISPDEIFEKIDTPQVRAMVEQAVRKVSV